LSPDGPPRTSRSASAMRQEIPWSCRLNRGSPVPRHPRRACSSSWCYASHGRRSDPAPGASSFHRRAGERQDCHGRRPETLETPGSIALQIAIQVVKTTRLASRAGACLDLALKSSGRHGLLTFRPTGSGKGGSEPKPRPSPKHCRFV
jgi:hypothetical protein